MVSLLSTSFVSQILLLNGFIFCSYGYSPVHDIEDTVEFPHESCSREIHNSFEFKTFHDAKPFYNPDKTLEIMVRFKGIADGHIALTVNSSATEPLYMIILGSYNNRFSEIRRTKQAQAKVKLNTPGIMTSKQWRGFVIKYNRKFGNLWVFPEGGDLPLMHWKDVDPLDISYFSFTAYRQRLLEVAYDCRPKDNYSSIPKTIG